MRSLIINREPLTADTRDRRLLCMPTLLYRAAIRDFRGDAILPLYELREQHPDLYEREAATLTTPSERALNRLRNLNETEPLLPWADIPYVLHRGALPIALFRDSRGRPL
jgi:hypothetical protein